MRPLAMACIAIMWAWTGVAQAPLAPGDVLFIDVPRHDQFSTSAEVDAQGNIELPFVGDVNVSGLTEADATARVRQALQSMIRNPRVSVSRTGYGMVEQFGRTAVMRTEIVPLHNAMAGDMATQLLGMSSDGGAISFHHDTNSLIITDTPDIIRNMMSVIARLDEMQSQLTQVRIEAKIAEVQVGALKELGIRWFAQGDKLVGGFAPPLRGVSGANELFGNRGNSEINEVERGGGGTGRGTIGEAFVNQDFDRRLQVPVQIPTTGQAFFGFFDGNLDIGAFIEALVAENKGELLANPNVITVNHQTANIEMIDEFPIFEFGVEASGRSTTQTRFIDIGIKLEVTPRVMRDDTDTYVEMEVRPDVSFPSGVSNGVPIISRRSVETIAHVRDGQTLVIGGIFRNDIQDRVTKIPLLGELPLFGKLFKRDEDTHQKTELLVFVTPRIHLKPETVTWDQMISITDPWADPANGELTANTAEARKD